MLKDIPKSLWAILGAVSLLLTGVFGTTPANAEQQYYYIADVTSVACNSTKNSINWDVGNPDNPIMVEFDVYLNQQKIANEFVPSGQSAVGSASVLVDAGTLLVTSFYVDGVWYKDVTKVALECGQTPSPSPSPTDPSSSPAPTETATAAPTPTVTVSPTTTAAPTPTLEPLASQSIKGPKKVLKKGKKAKLAKATYQGAKAVWVSKSGKTCKVKAGKVKAGKQKGVCRLMVTAPAVPGFKAFTKRYKVKVK